MQDLTGYAPIRVALTGIWRIVFGLLLASFPFALIYVLANTSGSLTSDAEGMQRWWVFVLAGAFTLVSLSFVLGGAGRIVSAFGGACYFRAGAEGIAIRLPEQGWFGRFRLIEHQFRWEEIEQLTSVTRSMNMIPVARELHIRLYGGKEVAIERFYFSAPIKQVLQKLQTIRATAAK